MVLWFNVQEHPKAQAVVFLILKRPRRRGYDLKSHLTDWEKPGIEPATPGLQDIGLSPTHGGFNILVRCTKITLSNKTGNIIGNKNIFN